MVNKVSKWGIYFCNLNPAEGSEQQGVRPAIIISNDAVNYNLPVSTVIPLSSVEHDDKIYPTEIFLPDNITGLPKDSVAMIQQIRTVPHNRFINKAGIIADEEYKKNILYAIKLYFEF
jgi:mRNA interferase MazF